MLSLATLKQSSYTAQDLQEWHILALAESMGIDDRREVDELYAAPPAEILRRSAERSSEPKAFVYLPDTVLCCCGVAPDAILSASGQIWCLTSELLPQHSLAFLRASRIWVREQQEKYSLLWNYVPVWHHKSIHWLHWLGFDLKLHNKNLLRVELRGV